MKKIAMVVMVVCAVFGLVAGAAFAAEEPSSGYREDKNYKRDFWVRFGARNVQELLELKGASYVPGSNQTMILFEFTKENGYVEGDILDIEFEGTYDSPQGQDLPLPSKDTIKCPTTITIKLPGATQPEEEEEIVVKGGDLETYFIISETYVAESVWKIVEPKKAYAGKTLTLDPTLTGVLISSDGKPSQLRSVKVTAADVKVTGEGDEEITVIAKKADIETADVSTYGEARKVSPVKLEPKEVSKGESYSVEFYVASDTWTPKTDGGDLVKIDVDQKRVTKSADGKTYAATDGNHIGTVTLWFTNVDWDKPEPNPYAPENDPRYKDDPVGGSSGGCNGGFGIAALALLPVVFLKKERKY